MRKNAGKGGAGKKDDEKKERNMAFMQAQAEAAFSSMSPERGVNGPYGGNALFVKRLEVFDH